MNWSRAFLQAGKQRLQPTVQQIPQAWHVSTVSIAQCCIDLILDLVSNFVTALLSKLRRAG